VPESTERLWETEPSRKTCLSTVVERRGDSFRLDRSLFKPKSRAYRHPQRHDEGTVWVDAGDKNELVTVHEDGQGVWHRVDGDPPEVGDEVQCHLDQDRRELDSRCHTAMHLFVRALTQLSDTQFVTDPEVKGGGRFRVDVRSWNVNPGQLAEAVDRVNSWIEANVPVEHGYASRDVAEHRLDPQPFQDGDRYPGPETSLSVVEIENVCAYPCDGTHADRTGDVDELVLREAEPRDDGTFVIVGEVPKPGRY
jgi:Ser-tRNA(Ala) deacylase AlaX